MGNIFANLKKYDFLDIFLFKAKKFCFPDFLKAYKQKLSTFRIITSKFRTYVIHVTFDRLGGWVNSDLISNLYIGAIAHPSPLITHPSSLTHRHWPLVPHPSLLSLHPYPSSLTHSHSPLSTHPSLLTSHHPTFISCPSSLTPSSLTMHHSTFNPHPS